MTAPPVDHEHNGLDLSLTLRRGEFELSASAHVRDGEVLAVLGPNGAGKSTLLRAVAGLSAIDTGRISLGDTVFDAPAEGAFVRTQQREVGVVFQNHRLFGQQRVLANVAFGPRARGTGKAAANTAANAWLERLGIGDLAQRRPGELSGGQAQRVALARALAGGPRALLLDEPLAALDVQTRAQVQGELRRHLAEFAGPTLLVTHDAIEALLLADRIVVLEHGRVVQHGTPAQITSMPSTPYVARLVGANLYRGVLDAGRVRLDAGVLLAAADVSAAPGPVLVAIRSSALTVHTAAPLGKQANVWPGVIDALAPLGDRIRVGVRGALDADVDIDAARLGAVDGGHFAPGQAVWLTVDPRDVRVYSPAPSGGVGGSDS